MSKLDNFIQEFKDNINDIDNTQAIPDPPQYTWLPSDGNLHTYTRLNFISDKVVYRSIEITIDITTQIQSGYEQIVVRAILHNEPQANLCLQEAYLPYLFFANFKYQEVLEKYVRHKMAIAYTLHLDESGYRVDYATGHIHRT